MLDALDLAGIQVDPANTIMLNAYMDETISELEPVHSFNRALSQKFDQTANGCSLVPARYPKSYGIR
jgi:hypothetical protein